MTTPSVTIDLDKIEHNARTIVGLCQAHGIEVCGVTKVTCGHPEVARAMLRGGVTTIADSRLENIQRLRAAGVDASFMLLRIPALSTVDAVVDAVDVSLNSEPSVLEALSDAAQRLGRIHDVILMIDLGDLREGVLPDDLVRLVKVTSGLPGIRIRGLGTNLACFGGVVPSEENMRRLVELSVEVEQALGLELNWISGINSSGLELIAAGKMHTRVNHARIGEAILLGRETTKRKPWPKTSQDAFVIHAEVLEVKSKPSQPMGKRSEDAFGSLEQFEDRGNELRALLNLGREDVDLAGIVPCEPGVEILGASSDYLVVDVSATAGKIRVGDELTFVPNYSALLAVMTSEYVQKYTLSEGKRMGR
ncbi:MAG: alanine/ornithine racemase family PLP-dependent enzyme [Gammaproteobacteria bacterium]|nr:alanine/ornithine racemase family PLP-dependent enzyme [Gammaproteobacteria bacterium]MDH3859096.1 alanine/ornithine racemase family PLP-dependent enzyme [Gammaproteobacteria bacterium]